MEASYNSNSQKNICYQDLHRDRVLGHGGFGTVYYGMYKGHAVAIKVLSGAYQDQFEREVEIMAKVKHENIVHFYGACFDAGNQALVMEYMSEGTLNALILSVKEIGREKRLRLLKGVASALNYLHEAGYLHNDLKSDNVLLDADHNPKLCDFGFSKESTINSTGGTCTGWSWCWAAPELINEQNPRFSKKADVYSYGVLAWQIEALKSPLAGLKLVDITRRVVEGKRDPIPSHTSKRISNLIDLCWDLDPEQRPRMSEVLKILESEEQEIQESISELDSWHFPENEFDLTPSGIAGIVDSQKSEKQETSFPKLLTSYLSFLSFDKQKSNSNTESKKSGFASPRNLSLEDHEFDGSEVKNLEEQEANIEKLSHGTYTSLSLSGWSKLTDEQLLVVLKKSPNLRHLDLSGCLGLNPSILKSISKYCPKLTHLKLNGWSHLSTLQNPPFPELTHLYLDDSGIKTLALKSMPLLAFLSVRNCSHLEKIDLNTPRLKELNLDGCGKLRAGSIFSCIQKCRELAEVSIKKCDLSSLKHHELLKKSPLLMKHNLGKLDGEILKTIFSLLYHPEPHLNLKGKKIGSERGIIPLSGAIATNKVVTTLDLYQCDIGNGGAVALSSALRSNTCLTHIQLQSNQIGDEGVIALSHALEVNYSVTLLDLSYNRIASKGAGALGEALKLNSTLSTLLIDNNKIGDDGAIALSDGLESNRSLQELSLSFNQVYDEGIIAISRIINQSALRTLSLSGNTIGSEALAALSKALKFNGTLAKIHLNAVNQIEGDERFAALFHNSIRELSLSKNHIKSIQIKELGKGFASLTRLNISHNSITSHGAAILLRSLNSLTWVDFTRNLLGHEISELDGVLPNCLSLKTMILKENYIGNSSIEKLAPALAISSLTSVDLSDNSFRSDGAAYLKKAMGSRSSVLILGDYWKNDRQLSEEECGEFDRPLFGQPPPSIFNISRYFKG